MFFFFLFMAALGKHPSLPHSGQFLLYVLCYFFMDKKACQIARYMNNLITALKTFWIITDSISATQNTNIWFVTNLWEMFTYITHLTVWCWLTQSTRKKNNKTIQFHVYFDVAHLFWMCVSWHKQNTSIWACAKTCSGKVGHFNEISNRKLALAVLNMWKSSVSRVYNCPQKDNCLRWPDRDRF